ncbi:MAG TPA: hypothetical protein VFC17_02820 [Candidatus Limnocylindrales bacterium]|nr:hypothetical protein [Candidatus Limnocylindrales bacterium]
MTVKELIAELQKHPDEMRVVVSGYEEGVDDISRLKPIHIKATPNPKPYYGRWDFEQTGEPAIFIFGRGRDDE